MDTTPPSDTSFVRQSLTDTLTSTARPSKAPLRSTRVSSAHTARRAKDVDTGAILKSLGLPSQEEEVNDDEDEQKTSMKGYSLPSGPQDFFPNTTTSTTTSHNSTMLSSEVATLKRKLAQSEKERNELANRCKNLESSLAAYQATRDDGKVLGAREYEELERQFDAQEKLLGGYQKENERSLVELESSKRKLLLYSRALTKVFGHDFESSISHSSSSSSDFNSSPSKPLTLPSTTSNVIAPLASNLDTSPEALAQQLCQVQLLVAGMERRLVQRQSELEELYVEAKQSGQQVEEAIKQIPH